MQRDRQRIAEPERARSQQSSVADEKEDRDVRAPRGLQHDDREKAGERSEPEFRAPLPRRDPYAGVRQQQDHDREAGGIEEVFPVDAQQKFGGDREDPGKREQPRRLRAQQSRSRKRLSLLRGAKTKQLRTRNCFPAAIVPFWNCSTLRGFASASLSALRWGIWIARGK